MGQIASGIIYTNSICRVYNIVSEIKDDAGNLICNVTYIMFVMDKLQEVPEKW